MPVRRIIKRSSTQGHAPDAQDLLIGELAVNLTDARLFSKDTGDNILDLTGLRELADDTSPVLGGNLDGDNNDLSDLGDVTMGDGVLSNPTLKIRDGGGSSEHELSAGGDSTVSAQNGRLAVGSGTPTSKLHVFGDGALSGGLNVGGDSDIAGWDIRNSGVVDPPDALGIIRNQYIPKLQDTGTPLVADWTNELVYWLQRGYNVNYDSSSGVTIANTGLVNRPHVGAHSSVRADHDAGGWMSVEFEGTFNTWGDGDNRFPYLQMRTDAQSFRISEIKVEVDNGTDGYHTVWDDTNPKFSLGLWRGTPKHWNEWSGGRPEKVKFTITFGTSGTFTGFPIIGWGHPNIQIGYECLPFMGEDNTFYGDNTFEGPTTFDGLSTFNADATFNGDVVLEDGAEVNDRSLRLVNLTSGSDGRFIRHTNVVDYHPRSASETGVLLIEFPDMSAGNSMMTLKITGYEYGDDKGPYEFIVGGYARSGSTWVRIGASVLGSPPATRVRLARQTTTDTHYIILGDTTTDWTYPAIQVDVMQAFGTGTDLSTGWDVSVASTLPGDLSIQEANVSSYGFDGYVYGDFNVNGTKNFCIPHPVPDKTDTYKLRHGSYEGPVPGGTIYRYDVEVEGVTIFELPDYFQYLNADAQVWCQPQGHFGQAYGTITDNILTITANRDGLYNILVLGTRKDPAIQGWKLEQEISKST